MKIRLSLLLLVLVLTGCFLPRVRTIVPNTPVQAATPQKPKPPSRHWHFPNLLLGLPFFHHKPPPPRAQALQRVGVIKTISADGSYVIIELEPGVMIPSGRDLVVLEGKEEAARLHSAENQPPFFIADIKSGQPSPGQVVFQ